MTSPAYDDSVFVNCAFTPDFEEMRQAMIFAIIDCGFVPRCTLEEVDSSKVRIHKIYELVDECKHGLHDISVTELSSNGLPRFNMPLELGIFLGAKWFGGTRHGEKSCLVLDRERYRYQEFCSDIAGQDPTAHHDDPSLVILRIRDWLRSQRKAVRLPSGERMAERFGRFQGDLPTLCDSLALEQDSLPFNDFTTVVAVWLQNNPP